MPWMVAGVRTQWDNMVPALRERTDIEPVVAEILPYRAGGVLEAVPGLPASLRGNVRTMLTGTALLAQRLDAVWTQNLRACVPLLLSPGRRGIPLAYTHDSTSRQQADLGRYYAVTSNGTPLAGLRDAAERRLIASMALINPWSHWAARSMQVDLGASPDVIEVIPPGIDLDRWPFHLRDAAPDRPVRILFVGGDFARKGGDLLLDVFRERLVGRAELHLVTRDRVPATEGVHVYADFMPNDPGLRDLYRTSDLFVLPTRADCFSLAGMEAMASGLPVVSTRVGGIPEIIEEGVNGHLTETDDKAGLAAILDTLVDDADRRRSLGAAGRRTVEARFDTRKNTDRLLDALVRIAAKERRRLAS